MPRSPVLWMAAGLLWILDASINIAMEPFRAFVGDQLPERQRPAGYRDAELLHRRGRGGREHAAVDVRAGGRQQRRHGQRSGAIPDTVRYSFYIGAVGAGRRDAVDDAHARANIRPASCTASPTPRRTPRASSPAAQRARARADSLWLAVGVAGARPASGSSRSTSSSISWAAASRRAAWRCWSIGGSAGSGMFAHAHARHRRHAAAHAPARARAVLLVVRAVRDVDLHDGGRDAGALRRTDTVGRRTTRAPTGWACCSRAYNGFAALAAIVIPWMVRTVRPAREPPRQPAARRRRAGRRSW